MPISFSSSVLNQLGAPAIYEDLIANRPAAGYKGRVFIGTDNFNMYRDNGISWDQLGGSASGTVTSITGTANQVIASSATGAVTLSLPQSIAVGSAPTFAGLTLSGLAAAGVVINGSGGALATAAGTGFLKMAAGSLSFDNTAYITLSSISATSPLLYNSGTGVFSIQVANTSQAGYLSSADWNTFNGKQGSISLTVTGASGSATLVGSTLNIPTYTLAGLGGISLSAISATSPVNYNNGTGVISMPAAATAQNGYLTATDWNTFNNKMSAISLTVTGASGSATLVGSTLNIPTYTLAGLGGISLSALSATSPLAYNNGTGAFSIQVANTSQGGYLTAADWNTFNGKQSNISGGTGVTITGGNTINIGQNVATSATPTFAGMTLTGSLNGINAFIIQPSTTSAQTILKLGGGNYSSTVYGANIFFTTGAFSSANGNRGGRITISSSNNFEFQTTDGVGVDATDTSLSLQPSGGTILFGGNLTSNSAALFGNGAGSANSVAITVNAGSSAVPSIKFTTGGVLQGQISSYGGVVYVGSNGNSTAITIDGSQKSTFANDLKVSNTITLAASSGMISSSALSPAGFNYTATTALNTPAFYYGYTGGGTATFTVPNPSLNNLFFYIKNVSGTVLTVQAFAGCDIITAAGATVSSFTLATGIGALLYSNGGTHTLQIS